MTDVQPSFTIEDALDIKSFADRSPIRFSPDGRRLAYCLEHFRGAEGRAIELWVTEVDTGTAHQVLPEARSAWGVSWHPADSTLACYADTGDGLQLWVWNADTGEARRVSPAIIAADFHFEVPQWTPDGQALVVKLANEERLAYYDPSGREIHRPRAVRPREDQVTVRCWSSQSQAEEMAQRGGGWMSGTLVRVEVATGEITTLAEEANTWGWAVSPDGRWVAFAPFAGRDVGSISGGNDLCVVPATGGERRVLAPYVRMNYGIAFSWSPDSSTLAYWDNGNVFTTGLGGQSRQLTQFEPKDRDEWYDQPLWSPDGRSLVVDLLGTVWRVPLDGEPVDLLPERGNMLIGHEFSPGGGPCFWSPDGRSVPVFVIRRDDDHKGFALVDLAGAGARKLHLRAGFFGDVHRFHVDISPGRGLIAFPYENASQPPDVWVIDGVLSTPRRVTRINPHLEGREWPAPQVLRWPDREHGPHRLAFYPPPAHFGPPPYPTVFPIYEGQFSTHNIIFGYEPSPCDNIHLYTHHGFAVCGPDIPMTEAGPARSVREGLAQAVQAVVEAGLADPQRLGIIGHSYGGYTVNCAITGLDCFAAAVSDTGSVNLTSAYGRVSDDGTSFCGYFEDGQGKMGAPPWAAAEKYVANSPLFQLDRVTTPVLIIHGHRDANLSQAWELFSGLRRLGKAAELAIYQGEDHWQGTWSRANIVDRWQRVLAWFDRYLLPLRTGR
jgi:dipeptidyl aminopeptidase/acylaminoacyl peptidase